MAILPHDATNQALEYIVRNAGDAVSLIQTAEGATNEITDMSSYEGTGIRYQ